MRTDSGYKFELSRSYIIPNTWFVSCTLDANSLAIP